MPNTPHNDSRLSSLYLEDIDNQGFEVAVDSVSDLRSGSYRSSVDRLWLSGYYGVGTPGGGPLYRDSDDTTTEDNGGTVFVDADGVRWKRPIAYGPNEYRSLSDLQADAASDIPDDFVIYLHGRDSVGDGGEGHFRWDSSDLSTEIDNDPDNSVYVPPNSDETGISGAWVRQSGVIDRSLIVSIPSMYPDMQSALNSFKKYRPVQGAKIVLNIESGYNIPSGSVQLRGEKAALFVEDQDASHFRITSDDAEVSVEPGFEGTVIQVYRANGPALDCLINMNSETNGLDGYSAERGSIGHVEAGAGVKNATRFGLWSRRASTVDAPSGVIFTGAGENGLNVNHGSRAYVRDGDFSGAGVACIRSRGATLVDAEDAIASDGEKGMLLRQGCNFLANNIDCSSSASIGIDCEEGVIGSCKSALVNKCDVGISLQRSCYIEAESISANDCTSRAFFVGFNSQLHAAAGEASDCGGLQPAIIATQSSVISFQGGTANMASGIAVQCEKGSEVNVRNANLIDAAENAVLCIKGSRSNIDGADGSGQGTSASFSVLEGSIINATGATGPISQTENSITADGIIFR